MQKLDLDYFEIIIAYKSLTDDTYLGSIVDYIKPVFFKNKDIKSLFTIIRDFYEKRGTKPTITEIKTYLITDELKASLKNVVNMFNGIDKNLNNDELQANTEIFLKEKAVYHTMMDVVELALILRVAPLEINTSEFPSPRSPPEATVRVPPTIRVSPL